MGRLPKVVLLCAWARDVRGALVKLINDQTVRPLEFWFVRVWPLKFWRVYSGPLEFRCVYMGPVALWLVSVGPFVSGRIGAGRFGVQRRFKVRSQNALKQPLRQVEEP